MASKIQLRRDSSANWTATNPILAEGEMGVELDTNRSKLGDGTSNWNSLLYMTDTNAVGTYDAKYLRKDADGGNQTVLSTGSTTFAGLVGAGGGVKVTGGQAGSVIDGLLKFNNEIRLVNTSSTSFVANDQPTFALGKDLDNDGSGGCPVGLDIECAPTSFTNAAGLQESRGLQLVMSPDNTTETAVGCNVRAEYVGTNIESSIAFSAEPTFNTSDSHDLAVGFGNFVPSTNTTILPAERNILFYGNYDIHRDQATTNQNYNFFTVGNAPNFYKGDTFIGGTASRNTRELWESTLTEEQKEQLAAGRLVIPANVSTPGDGSFARQWWYDQQDAETQALLDSGETEYPAPYAAANFVDTFNIDATAALKLGSNSTIDSKGYLNFSDTRYNVGLPKIGFNSNADNSLATYTAGIIRNYIDANGTTNVVIDDRPGDIQGYKVLGTVSATSNAFVGYWSNPTSPVGASADNNINYVTHFLASPQNSYIDKFASGDSRHAGFTAGSGVSGALLNVGFYGELAAGNPNSYNFYAAGTASNYFRGQILLPGASSSIIIDADPIDGGSNDPFANNGGTEIKYAGVRVSNKDGVALELKREEDGILALFYQGAPNVNTQKGSISVDAAGVSFNDTSDYRLKSNVVDLPAASEVVKTLQPRSYSIGGLDNVSGFIAHELQAVVPRAVTGTKDATEAIGTLYDFDGSVLETEIVEPPAEAQSYVTEEGETRVKSWTPTGTRPVYQGVDQTKLIPLLTKALQEALDRVEQLESQLSSGGGSDFESRIASLETDMARFKAL